MNIPKKEEGQGLVEYALLLVLIAIVVLVILTVLGSQVVLVFARVAGGISGDTLDAGAGDNAVIVNYGGTINQSGSDCNGTITNITFVAVDSNGSAITNQTATATLLVNGQNRGTISGQAGSTGIAVDSGSHAVSGTCPLQITAQ